jgi:hypothetical protein
VFGALTCVQYGRKCESAINLSNPVFILRAAATLCAENVRECHGLSGLHLEPQGILAA